MLSEIVFAGSCSNQTQISKMLEDVNLPGSGALISGSLRGRALASRSGVEVSIDGGSLVHTAILLKRCAGAVAVEAEFEAGADGEWGPEGCRRRSRVPVAKGNGSRIEFHGAVLTSPSSLRRLK